MSTLQKMIKVLACLGGIFLLCSTGGGGAAAAEKPLTLKLFRMPDPKDPDPFNQADIAVIRAFQKKYPHIELKPFAGIHIEGMAMDAAPLLAIAGGTSPDIIYVNFRQSHTYIREGFLYPMDEFLKDVPDELLNLRVAKPVWPVIRRPAEPGGKEYTWTLPTSLLVRTFSWRKDLFARAGMDPERPPQDWEELLEYARRLTNPKDRTYGLFMHWGGAGTSWEFINYLWSAGGEVMAQNEEGEWRAVFDCEAAVEAVLFFLRLNTERWTDATGREHRGYVLHSGLDDLAWDEGRVGMRMAYLGEASIGGLERIDPALVGIAPVPLGPTGLRGSEVNAMMMGIFAGQKDPRVREAAFQYIWFYDSEEARRIRLEVLIKHGYGPFLNPVYLKRFGYEEFIEDAPETWLPVWEEAMRHGRPEPYGTNAQLIFLHLTLPLDQAMELEYRGMLGNTDEERRQKVQELLTQAVARTNEEMIGEISPRERRFRNNLALIIVIILVTAFSLVLWRIWRIFTPKEEGRRPRGWGLKKYWGAYLIMLPAVASIFLWMYFPMAMGSRMAFQDYGIVRESLWVGLNNFGDVLFDATWWSSIGRTFYYMLLMLGLGFWPPILLAILLQEVSRGKIFYRTVFYLPAVITGFVVIYLWRLFYDPSAMGVLNQIIGLVGISPQRWLGDARLAMLACVLPTVWAGMGLGCLIYLAALKGIPDELYEAADVDGASFFDKIRYIVIPSLKALIIIQFIGAFIAASQGAGFILVMTFGGPAEATKVAELHIFEKAYLYLRFGTATTMAWLLGLMLIGFTVHQLKILSGLEFRAAGTMEK
ncbi:MAG: L-arabinose transport system permease protein AraP [Syntrophomonadaceae bacterium]|nr:L-arabinose transport system permease protein AraP [Bacillota bacterium]